MASVWCSAKGDDVMYCVEGERVGHSDIGGGVSTCGRESEG